MKFLGEYAANTRVRLVVIVALAATLAAIIAAFMTLAVKPKPAEARYYDPCSDAHITQIVKGITGEDPFGFACYHSTYDRNLKPTDSFVTKANKITPAFYTCGNSTAGRHLAQALIERTGVIPVTASPSGHCNQSLYQNHMHRVFGTSLGTIDWNNYNTDSYPTQNVEDAVQITLGKCGITDISMAIMEVTGQLPKNSTDLEDPGQLGSKYFSGNGQCESTLYYNGGAAFGGYDSVKTAVRARATSTKQCGDSLITTAYQRMTGWNPLPDNPTSLYFNECDIQRYNGGQWGSFADLKNYVHHSWRCEHPWIGQAYAKDFARKANGRGSAGECSEMLYGRISTGTWSASPDPNTFQTMRNRVAGVSNALTNQGWSFSQSGGGDMRNINGRFAPGGSVLIKSSNGVIATGAGNVIANGAGNVIANGAGNVIAVGAGNVIAVGAGNVIANGAGNVIATGGGNIQSGYSR